jgi:murein DD-endopeptidase MepM/ murein hydrolase activator NlpD
MRMGIREKKKKNKKKDTYFTMLMIPHGQAKPIRNICIPMWLIKFGIVAGLSCVLTVGYFVSGYFHLQYIAEENKELQKINKAQASEITDLKGMAGDMKTKLDALLKIDQEVRTKVGLIKPKIQSSRSLERYPYMAANTVNVRSAIERLETGTGTGTGTETGLVLELPIPEGEVNTLDELKDQLFKMDILITQQAKTMDKLKTDVERQIALKKATPNVWPVVGRITSEFGWRKNPFSHRGSEYHQGLDIAASYGAPIYAAGDGVVTFSGYKASWGKLVVISHGFGYVSQYAHNSSLLVKKGEKVTRGQIIARLGRTGRATGAHLHFGIAKNGKWIDPLQILNK